MAMAKIGQEKGAPTWGRSKGQPRLGRWALIVALWSGVAPLPTLAGEGIATGAAEEGEIPVGAPGPTLPTSPAQRTAALPRVAVDVGHSLKDSGAISARGRSEFSFNLDLARQLATALEAKHLAVTRINFDGKIPSLAARPEAAVGADYFISLHHDSLDPSFLHPWEWEGRPETYNDEPRFRGFALFISHRNPDVAQSLACASAIGARLRRLGFARATHHSATALGTPRPWADETNGVRFYDTLLVTSHTTVPAVLLEAGMLKNREEELALADPANQARMADGIATGLAACMMELRADKGEGAVSGPFRPSVQDQ